MGVVQRDATGLRAGAPRHVQPLRGHQARPEAEPVRAVVVAGDHHHGHARVHDDARQHVVQQRHGLGRRHGAVIDIAGDQHGVWPDVTDQRDELVEHMGLVFEQAAGVEQPTKMPVGGVEKTQSESFGAVAREHGRAARSAS